MIRTFAIICALWSFCPLVKGAIDIELDYSLDGPTPFFSSAARRTAMEAAASYFEGILGDDLDAIVPGPSGFGFPNTWSAVIDHPGTGGTEIVEDLIVPENTIRVYVGGRELGGALGIGGPGGFTGSGTAEWLQRLRGRGEPNASGAGATDFGLWGGSLTFDISTNWHFGVDTLPPSGRNDFLSVALHELGHLLGLGTASSWDTWVSGDRFTGPAATSSFGSDVPLDGDVSHWREGVTSEVAGVAQESAMDPTLLVGTRKRFTALDVAALEDIGWEIVTPTIPCDLNADTALDAGDAAIMFGNWGGSGSGDCNGDGTIDAADAAELFARWTGDATSQSVPEPVCAYMYTVLGGLAVARRGLARSSRTV